MMNRNWYLIRWKTAQWAITDVILLGTISREDSQILMLSVIHFILLFGCFPFAKYLFRNIAQGIWIFKFVSQYLGEPENAFPPISFGIEPRFLNFFLSFPKEIFGPLKTYPKFAKKGSWTEIMWFLIHLGPETRFRTLDLFWNIVVWRFFSRLLPLKRLDFKNRSSKYRNFVLSPRYCDFWTYLDELERLTPLTRVWNTF